MISMSVLNLKYHFQQLNQEIGQMIRTKMYQELASLLHYHNELEKETELLNNEIKYHFYFLYKWVKPTFNTFLCLLFMDDTIFVMRIVVTLALMTIVLVLYLISDQCSSVITSAHKTKPAFYSLLMSRDNKIPLKLRLKFLQFVEHLSEHEIGFTCYEFFTITRKNFFEYVLDWIFSYFLLIKILKKNGVLWMITAWTKFYYYNYKPKTSRKMHEKCCYCCKFTWLNQISSSVSPERGNPIYIPYIAEMDGHSTVFDSLLSKYCLTSIIASGRDQTFVDLQLKSLQLSRNFFIQ